MAGPLAVWNPPTGDSDDELESEETFVNKSKTATIIIIDCSPQMFASVEWSNDSEDNPYRAAIMCCISLWKSKVVSSPKDRVTILLMGTEQSKNTNEFSNLYVLQDFSTVTVGMIKELKEIADSPNLRDFDESIGCGSTYNLVETFWLCRALFDEGKTKSFARKIVLFTCEDNPRFANDDSGEGPVEKFRDLGKVDFSIVSFNKEFKLGTYYSQIVDDPTAVSLPVNLPDLLKVVRMKQRVRRPISSLMFEMFPGTSLSVGIYSFLRPAPIPKAVMVQRRSNKVLEKAADRIRVDTGLPSLVSEERKVITVAGQQVIFTNHEAKEAKLLETNKIGAGATLIGFVDKAAVDCLLLYVSPNYFMYPNDDKLEGSKDFFTCLMSRCEALKKVAIIQLVLSRGRPPRLACLIPSTNSEAGLGSIPEGAVVFLLPFNDEIRKNLAQIDAPQGEASGTLLDLVEQFLKKLTMKNFSGTTIQNPHFQMKWRQLEKLALGHVDDEFVDGTDPNIEMMTSRTGMIQHSIIVEAKREAPETSQPQPQKRPKLEINFANEAKHKRLEKLTVADLKEFLESKGVSCKMWRKAQLVDAVYKHFS